jgi:predicted AAA+ superfamily ATPase
VTLDSYVEKLEELFVIRDIDAWTPQIRSKTAIRSGKKHIFVDPSIGIAALGLNPDYFNNDLDLFGHAFENLVLRDLLVFAGAHNARILHYTDDTGIEADAVYQMEDGRYALIEIKTGVNKIPEAEKTLLKFRDVIRKYNEEAKKNPEHPRAIYREPSALIVICATAQIAYTTDNGVKIVPVGCLRD